ncbi:helix-turn-helix transcriptional regulator [Gulosibacter chungangensis]|uniref:AraC family transcriptional regulator n=1 Tax=Gulosibacter chungangensis TaxID=979746 RepID=A0A7J5BF14_9MICO|nr:AraC family transcriptional regulator [Gulosibacter chungangensis]KAB1644843.1 AraC family transcriptional regulator [Gulosibacter chungangensis]
MNSRALEPDGEILQMREIHRTGSVDDAELIGNRLFHPHIVHPMTREADFVFAATSATVGPVSIGTFHYAHGVRVDTEPYENWYHVNVALTGAFRTLVGDTRVEANVFRAAVYGPDVPTEFSGFERPTIILAIKMRRRTVEEIAQQVFGGPLTSPVELGTTIDVSHGAGLVWFKLVQRVFNGTAQPGGLNDALADYLGKTIIEWFLRSTHPAQIAPVLAADELSVFERAKTVIHVSEGAPISLETLAAVSGVSGRTLQNAFRDSIGQSPMQYQLTLRLSKVREVLQHAESGSVQIADIARRYGFSHLGRFAAQYAREFGERPSDTLNH